MTLAAAADRLWRAAHQLRDDTQALRLHAVEDRPGRQDEPPSKLVEQLETASLTLAGWVEETLDAAAKAMAASGDPGDPARLRRALDACADAAERVAAQLTDELSCSRRLDELNEFAHGGREQRAWVAAIKDAVDRIAPSAWAVPFALAACWQALAEGAVLGPAPGPADPSRRS